MFALNFGKFDDRFFAMWFILTVLSNDSAKSHVKIDETKMDSEFIPYLFIIILVFMSKINSTDIKVHGKSEILSRNARTTGYVPSQSGIGVSS